MIDPTGLTTYTYDALNRLTSITNNKGFTTSFSYDALGRRTSMTHGNGVVTNHTYDAASQLQSLIHQFGATTIDSFTYSYDKVGNRKSKADNNGAANYTYDTLNRLVQAVNPLPSNPLESFTYDPVGNRTNSNQNGASTFNQANQLLEDANFNYQYDNNGNLTRKTPKTTGPITSYEYDAENKLVRVVSNGTTVNYRYDGLGRRVEKEVTNVSTKVSRYIYDNEDILLELDGSNTITARYTHGPGIDEPLIMERTGASFFYQADGLGSITDITDSGGVIKQRYTYSSFGKIESQLDPSFVQPYTFTPREFDPETGLYYYRARYYDPTAGRFLQQDPVKGQREIPQSQNLYPYVINDPVRLNDPTGEVIPLAAALVGVGALAGGSLEAVDSLLKGGGAGDVLKAFGRGAIAGGLGTITAIAVGAATGNPFLIGASAGLTFDFMRQGITNGFQIQCIDVGSLAFSTLTGAALGPVASRIPGLRLVGREPSLFQPRSLSDFGPNSIRLLQQETIGAGLGSIADQLYDAFPTVRKTSR